MHRLGNVRLPPTSDITGSASEKLPNDLSAHHVHAGRAISNISAFQPFPIHPAG
jgi:hypothetical protein